MLVEPVSGQETSITIDKQMEISGDNSESWKLQADPVLESEGHCILRLSPAAWSVSPQYVMGKNSFLLLAGVGEKEPFKNIPEYSTPLHKPWPQEKLINQNQIRWVLLETKWPGTKEITQL